MYKKDFIKAIRVIKLFDNIILYIVLHKQFEQHCYKEITEKT